MSILSDTMRMGASQPSADTAYQIEKSLRFEKSDSSTLSRTFSSAGNRQKFTVAFWAKLSKLDTYTAIFTAGSDSTNDKFQIYWTSNQFRVADGFSSVVMDIKVNRLSRDFSAFSHYVVAVDTTQSISTERVKIYINGKLETSFATTDYPSQNANSNCNNNVIHWVGGVHSSARYFSGYVSDVFFIDGLQLSPAAFGSFDDAGNWNPKEFALPAPNNGTTWSGQVTAGSGLTNGTNLFNGNISSSTHAGNGSWLKWTPSGGMEVKHTVEVYWPNTGNATSTLQINDDASTNVSLPHSTWTTIYLNGTLTELKVTGASGENPHIGAIRIDGVILVDGQTDQTYTQWAAATSDNVNSFHLKFNNASDLGEDSLKSNDFTVNNLQTADTDWLVVPSSEITGSGSALTSNMFDGSLSTQVSSSDGGRVYWTPGSNITINTNGLKAYWSSTYIDYKNAIESDGGTDQIVTITSGNANSWVTFTDFDGETIGPSNKLTFRSYRANDSDPGVLGFKAIEVNGQLVNINSNELADLFNDTPTNYEDGGTVHGNYCTLNPLKNGGLGLSQGNLQQTLSSGATWKTVGGTFGVSSGKWYFEYEVKAGPSSPDDHIVGWAKEDFNTLSGNLWTDTAHSYSSNGWYRYNTGSNIVSLNSYTVGDVIGVAINFDNGNLYFYKNGTAENSGNAVNTTSITGLHYPIVANWSNGDTCTGYLNFGQRAFKYTNAGTNRPAADYKALCTQNLDDTFSGDALNDPSKYFDVKLRNGFGTAGGTVTTGFTPGLVWEKTRSGTGDHFLYDRIRGTGKWIETNTVNAESAQDLDQLASFTSNGYTIGTNEWTTSTTLVSWNWNAGTAAATVNTDGDIDPTHSWVNATAGFNIIRYQGNGSNSTVGHNLGAKPHFRITKWYSNSTAGNENWSVYHHSIGAGSMMNLDLTDAKGTSSVYFNNTEPTNNLFTVGTHNAVNENNTYFISYNWTEIPGFSKFGHYVGTGSSTNFIYLGFKPKWFMLKPDANDSWRIFDIARSPNANPVNAQLQAQSNNAELAANDYKMHFNSNGIELQENLNSGINGSGTNFYYAAFAEHPFKTSRAQ